MIDVSLNGKKILKTENFAKKEDCLKFTSLFWFYQASGNCSF